jgi:hypothetical protein
VQLGQGDPNALEPAAANENVPGDRGGFWADGLGWKLQGRAALIGFSSLDEGHGRLHIASAQSVSARGSLPVCSPQASFGVARAFALECSNFSQIRNGPTSRLSFCAFTFTKDESTA